MKYTFLLIVFIISLSCNPVKKESATIFCSNPFPDLKIEPVSLKKDEKIKKLEGNFIQTEGYIGFNFENAFIYSFKSSYIKNTLWLGKMITDSASLKKVYSLNGKRVWIIGKVSLSSKGHYIEYLGTLDSIICLKAL